MGEATVATHIHPAWFHSRMSRVQTSPVTAKMAKMPLFLNEPVLLHLSQFVKNDLADNPVVNHKGMATVLVVPMESFVDLAARPECSGWAPASRWWRRVEPAVIVFTEGVE